MVRRERDRGWLEEKETEDGEKRKEPPLLKESYGGKLVDTSWLGGTKGEGVFCGF